MNELQKKFIVPPFSILDTKQGYWQNRRKNWLKIGIKSEEGRNAVCMPTHFDERKYGKKINQGVSIFDPVLCEIIYKWFCIPNGNILDPFAGGSVRGVVAEYLKYIYTGIELRKEQVEANNEQAEKIFKNNHTIKWIEGDSNKKLDEIDEKYDLIFTCPPYWNLEVYSDLEGELSNYNTYKEFLYNYQIILSKSVKKLKDNRFFGIVVSNIRDKEGKYINFVNDTIESLINNDLKFYNDIILVNAVGTLPIRAGKIFKNYRKVGKMHQNILIFYKGNVKKIKELFSNIDVGIVEKNTLLNFLGDINENN